MVIILVCHNPPILFCSRPENRERNSPLIQCISNAMDSLYGRIVNLGIILSDDHERIMSLDHNRGIMFDRSGFVYM